MRTFAGILFSIMMLAPGLHLTVDYHICHDRIAGSSVSFTGQHAPGCNGDESPACEGEEQIMNHCCSGFTATYTTADDFVHIPFSHNSIVHHELVLVNNSLAVCLNYRPESDTNGYATIADPGGLKEPLIDLFCVYRI